MRKSPLVVCSFGKSYLSTHTHAQHQLRLFGTCFGPNPSDFRFVNIWATFDAAFWTVIWSGDEMRRAVKCASLDECYCRCFCCSFGQFKWLIFFFVLDFELITISAVDAGGTVNLINQIACDSGWSDWRPLNIHFDRSLKSPKCTNWENMQHHTPFTRRWMTTDRCIRVSALNQWTIWVIKPKKTIRHSFQNETVLFLKINLKNYGNFPRTECSINHIALCRLSFVLPLQLLQQNLLGLSDPRNAGDWCDLSKNRWWFFLKLAGEDETLHRVHHKVGV